MWIEHGAEELATRGTLPPWGRRSPSISQGYNGPVILGGDAMMQAAL